MAVYRPTYTDKNSGEKRQSETWWYEFIYAGRRVRESAKTGSKTVARAAEKQRRRELEEGFNGLTDNREDRIRSVKQMADEYLQDYKLRHRSGAFAEYAVGHVTRHVGRLLVVDVNDKTVTAYQIARLKEGAAPKTINEEVGFLLRILGEPGEAVRARLRRSKSLKLTVHRQIGKAYTPEEKRALLAAAERRTDSQRRSLGIYPALMLALNAGMRDSEIRCLQWGRVDFERAFLTVGDSKTEAGQGRTIPLNSALKTALVNYSKWYTSRFGSIQPEWYVFPFGKPMPNDPTRPVVTLKTAWNNVRKEAGVTGRWHDNRHTLITDLAESGAGDETIRDIAGHVSKQMLKHYSHIRMEAKRKALESIVTSKPEAALRTVVGPEHAANSVVVLQEIPKVTHVN